MEKKQSNKNRQGAHNKPGVAPAVAKQAIVKSENKEKAKDVVKPPHKSVLLHTKTKAKAPGRSWSIGGQPVTKSSDNSMVSYISQMHSYKPSPTGLGKSLAVQSGRAAGRLAASTVRFILDNAGTTVWTTALCSIQAVAWHTLNDMAELVGGADALFEMSEFAVSQRLSGKLNVHDDNGEPLALYDLLKFAIIGKDSTTTTAPTISGSFAAAGPKILKDVVSGLSPKDVVGKYGISVAMPFQEASSIESEVSPDWKPIPYAVGRPPPGPDEPSPFENDEDLYHYLKDGIPPPDLGTQIYGDLDPTRSAPGAPPRTGFTNVDSHSSGYHTSYDVIETPYGHGLVLKGEQVLGYVLGGLTTGSAISFSSSMATVVTLTGGGGFIRLGVDTLGGRMASIARLYQRYMFETVTLNWEPDVATSIGGSVAISMDSDGDGPGPSPYTNAPTYEESRVLPKNMVTSYWYPKSLSWKCPAMDEWLYTYGNSGTAVADFRQTNAATIYVRPSGVTPATMPSTAYGWISIKYTLVLAGPTSDLGFTLSGAVAKQLGPSHVDSLAQVITSNPVPFYEMCRAYGFESEVLDPSHVRLRQKLVDLGILCPYVDTPYEAWARRQNSNIDRLVKKARSRRVKLVPESPPTEVPKVEQIHKECTSSCQSCFTLIGKLPPSAYTCFRGGAQ